MIKVYLLNLDQTEDKELGFAEAQNLVTQALSQGRIVVDKRNGNVIDSLTPDVAEIMVIALVDGG